MKFTLCLISTAAAVDLGNDYAEEGYEHTHTMYGQKEVFGEEEVFYEEIQYDITM